MRSIVRNGMACVAGLVVGSAVNMAIVSLGPWVVPPPPGVDVTDPEALRASIHLFEPRHFAPPFLAHALGTLAGSFVGFVAATGRREWVARGIGAVFLGGGVAASTMIPAPWWFIALDLTLAYLPMSYLAARLGERFARGG